jgi:hypothetical protein
VNATVDGLKVTVTVTAGPGEPVEGVLQLRRGNRSGNLVAEVQLLASGSNRAVFTVQWDAAFTSTTLGVPCDVFFLGSDRLQAGKASMYLKVPNPA